MKILITGVNGQLGSELKEILTKDLNKLCYFLDREQLPLDQTEKIKEILESYQPDAIIHAAAYTAVDKAETEVELANTVNHLASKVIAEYSAEHSIKLIAVSTDYVFNGNSDKPLDETASVDPVNIYGKTKLDGENAILNADPNAIIIRTSWVYSIYGNNFVKTMIRLMSERDSISVINDQIGSPTYAFDLAKAIVDILDARSWLPGIYHYSNEGEISWFEFAQEIKAINKLSCLIQPIPTSDYPTPAKRPHFSLLDKSKIKKTFDLSVPDWKESLQRMIGKLNH